MKFSQDKALLEKRYYELSREMHPDRFTTSSADARAASLIKMSDLNQAFQTLKNRDLLRSYILKLNGLALNREKSTPAHVIPTDIAEAWFELQDLLFESPDAARPQTLKFEENLKKTLRQSTEQLMQLEEEYDRAGQRDTLDKIQTEIQKQSYLLSIEKAYANSN